MNYSNLLVQFFLLCNLILFGSFSKKYNPYVGDYRALTELDGRKTSAALLIHKKAGNLELQINKFAPVQKNSWYSLFLDKDLKLKEACIKGFRKKATYWLLPFDENYEPVKLTGKNVALKSLRMKVDALGVKIQKESCLGMKKLQLCDGESRKTTQWSAHFGDELYYSGSMAIIKSKSIKWAGKIYR